MKSQTKASGLVQKIQASAGIERLNLVLSAFVAFLVAGLTIPANIYSRFHLSAATS